MARFQIRQLSRLEIDPIQSMLTGTEIAVVAVGFGDKLGTMTISIELGDYFRDTVRTN